MARAPKLKVFRTAIGFHDAFVAAPSQKDALKAWGARSNLFARGVAEVVTDPRLAKTALATPGKVVKVLRGSPAEQLAALGKADATRASKAETAKPRRAVKPPPRPSRAALDGAEAALAEVEARHREQTEALDREEAALRRRQATLRDKQDRERTAAENKREAARATYDRAMEKWRAD